MVAAGPCIECSLRSGATLAPENLYLAPLSIVTALGFEQHSPYSVANEQATVGRLVVKMHDA